MGSGMRIDLFQHSDGGSWTNGLSREEKEYKESSLYFAISVVSTPVMSRPLRASYRGAIYHVTARGTER